MSSPFINAGYTDTTVFKVLEAYENLEKGQLVTIYYDDGSSCPSVKNKDGAYSDMYLPNATSPELEVVAENGIKEGISDENGDLKFSTYDEWLRSKGSTNERCIVADVLKGTIQTKRTHQDYRNMSPDDKIKIVIDGCEGEVPLADLVIIKHILNGCNGSYLEETYEFLKCISNLGTDELVKGWDFRSFDSVNVYNYEDELISNFFISSKLKEIKEKLASKQKEREDLDSEIQALQSELENL